MINVRQTENKMCKRVLGEKYSKMLPHRFRKLQMRKNTRKRKEKTQRKNLLASDLYQNKLEGLSDLKLIRAGWERGRGRQSNI